MGVSPVIYGLEGPVLTAEERALFADLSPAGFILFARNVEDPMQVQELTDSLRDSVGYEPLILIDQEGGRVQRLTSPHWRRYVPMGSFAPLFKDKPSFASRLLRLHCRMIGTDLRSLGINVNCLPLLDTPIKGSDNIIGDRALASDPGLVAALGRIVSDSLQESGVLPVIKHIPGHGRAMVDSHLALPRVDASLRDLRETDFLPFTALADAPLAMTAHITYSDIDPKNPATLSSIVIGRVIRMLIGFQGLLMSDDIGMKALNGSMGTLTREALKAGCDLVLHCSGNIQEMAEIAQVKTMTPSAGLKKKIDHMLKPLQEPHSIDRLALEEEYDSLMQQAGLGQE